MRSRTESLFWRRFQASERREAGEGRTSVQPTCTWWVRPKRHSDKTKCDVLQSPTESHPATWLCRFICCSNNVLTPSFSWALIFLSLLFVRCCARPFIQIISPVSHKHPRKQVLVSPSFRGGNGGLSLQADITWPVSVRVGTLGTAESRRGEPGRLPGWSKCEAQFREREGQGQARRLGQVTWVQLPLVIHMLRCPTCFLPPDLASLTPSEG